jgi:hypothetical protein
MNESFATSGGEEGLAVGVPSFPAKQGIDAPLPVPYSYLRKRFDAKPERCIDVNANRLVPHRATVHRENRARSSLT